MMLVTQLNSYSTQIQHLKLSNLQLQTDCQCCKSMLQYGVTLLHEAVGRGATDTTKVLLKAGADFKAIGEVRSNVLNAIASIVHYCALSAAIPCINMSIVYLVQGSNANDVAETNEQQ